MQLSQDHWILTQPIAHRGLHNSSSPENTFLAFAQAIKHNHPIELDLQILKDGTIVVFHDFDLQRLCQSSKKLININLDELKKFKILNSQPIPTLDEALKFVNNQVPLLIEIKNEKLSNPTLHQNILTSLKNYSGRFSVQAFNPNSVRFFKKNLVNEPTGLLSGSFDDTQLNVIKKIYLRYCLDSFICKPDYISYEAKSINRWANIFHNKVRKIPFIAWTIKNKSQINHLPDFCSNYIFDSKN